MITIKGMTATEFSRQSEELAKELLETLSIYPKEVVICVLTGTTATLAASFKIPRGDLIAMLDSAQKDMS
jgi:hypothetical protein